MKRSVHSHVGIALFPVESGLDRFARGGQDLAFSRDVNDIRLAIPIEGGGDRNLPRPAGEFPGIARLAAGGRIKYRSIQDDAAPVIHTDDARLAGA